LSARFLVPGSYGNALARTSQTKPLVQYNSTRHLYIRMLHERQREQKNQLLLLKDTPPNSMYLADMYSSNATDIIGRYAVQISSEAWAILIEISRGVP
jgi:hypothetical protein